MISQKKTDINFFKDLELSELSPHGPTKQSRLPLACPFSFVDMFG
jgi:hypothetical protein